MRKILLLLLLATMTASSAIAASEETVGMLVTEAMRPGNEDAQLTGRAFLDTLESIRRGGNVQWPDNSCDTPQCVGTFMAIETVREGRRKR